MRLTKNIREKILRQNEGFITQTSYYKKEWIADEEGTHSFLYKNKDDMNLDGLE